MNNDSNNFSDAEDSSNLNSNSNPSQSNDWVTEDAVNSMVTEKTMNPEESDEDTARRLLRENAGMAVLGIVHTAQYGASDRIRLEAQKYIVERVLGKTGDDAFGQTASPLTEFITSITEYVAAEAK